MQDEIIWILIGMAVLNLVFLLLVFFRSSSGGGAAVREELRQARMEAAEADRMSREELSNSLAEANKLITNSLNALSELQKTQLGEMSKQIQSTGKSNSESLDRIRETFDLRVKELQTSNEKKLDEMRKTVDEKLHDTLEKRLGESFKLVQERLEAVHRGLGEMQTLATGVGDLKRVLTNVKTRGTWAEVQLGNLLEQVLAPSQFGRNIKTRSDSNDLIEYAVRLPGSSDDPDNPVWLPIDSKFPQEDYLRLQDAAEAADPDQVQKATDDLAKTIRIEAQRISKYLNPPTTTDFAIMFLPTEGLYAEVARYPNLADDLRNKFNIVVAGPTNLAAILNSFSMGFRTLAISQQSSEVWKILGAVKTEFGKFADILARVKKQLETASRTIDQTGARTRALEKSLRGVESLPETTAQNILGELPMFETAEEMEAEAED